MRLCEESLQPSAPPITIIPEDPGNSREAPILDRLVALVDCRFIFRRINRTSDFTTRWPTPVGIGTHEQRCIHCKEVPPPH